MPTASIGSRVRLRNIGFRIYSPRQNTVTPEEPALASKMLALQSMERCGCWLVS